MLRPEAVRPSSLIGTEVLFVAVNLADNALLLR